MSKWNKVKLVDVCNFQGGSQPPKEQWIDQARKGYIRMLQIRDFTQNRVGKEEYIRITKTIKTCDNSDVLIARYGASVGKILSGMSGAYNVAIMKTIPNTDRLDKRYLRMFLLSTIFQNYISNVGFRAAQAGFNKSDLEDLYIPLPPLETQKQIAQTLDTASELLAIRKQQLAEMDNLIKSTFYDLIGDPFENHKGWDKCQLSDLALIIMGQSPKGSSYNEKGEGTPLLNGPTEFGTRFPIEKQWTTEPTKMCQKEDILFCVRGATAGKMNISDKDYCIGRGLAALRPKNSSTQSFIYLYMKMMYNHFQSTSNGSTFININKEQLNNLPFLKVDTVIQEKFSKFVLKIEEQKALVKKAIDETQYLLDSLMSQYFE